MEHWLHIPDGFDEWIQELRLIDTGYMMDRMNILNLSFGSVACRWRFMETAYTYLYPVFIASYELQMYNMNYPILLSSICLVHPHTPLRLSVLVPFLFEFQTELAWIHISFHHKSQGAHGVNPMYIDTK